MKSLFNKEDYNEIVARLEKMPHNAPGLWGKMDGAQMLAHSSEALKMAIGDIKLPRLFIGRVLGGIFKKGFLSEKPFSKGSPTAKEFIFTDKRDFEKEKAELLTLMKRFHEGGEKGATKHPHSFFGPLTAQQWGESQWKHLDHHLRQFGA